MTTIDLVFEGGGAKGIVFVGALQALLGTPDEPQGFEPGRLLGTSAGAITATFLAARYTVPEMLDALAEQDEAGEHVFNSFLGAPMGFEREAIRESVLRNALASTDIPLVPNWAEERVDEWLATTLANHRYFRHVFSFVELGGWYSADPFVAWLQRKLDEGTVDGEPRRFSGMTLAEFHRATGSDLTLIAADTTGQRMLILNHNTAPDLPVVWAVRMSMSLPLVWQEVVWQEGWGRYTLLADEEEIDGHVIVDGGMLSNFPIALFLSPDVNVRRVMGTPASGNVLGLLIDERLPVPNAPPKSDEPSAFNFKELRTAKRIGQMIDTMTRARDNVAIKTFKDHVVRLPAKGYGTTEFDMSDGRRTALVTAGREAMEAYLATLPSSRSLDGPAEGMAPDAATSEMASEIAADILEQ